MGKKSSKIITEGTLPPKLPKSGTKGAVPPKLPKPPRGGKKK